MISFTGDVPNSTERVVTGLYSLDRAVGDSGGNIGFPLRTLVELYGKKGIGKTSFCLSMMGRIADKTGKPISILDFERQDPDTVSKILSLSGYEGDVRYITNQAKETPEDTLERFVDTMFTKQPPIGLVDSIGGFYPNAELEGKIGDSNMGVRAREIGQFSRRLVRSLQIADSPHSIFMTNHEHPTIGGMTQGTITPGGETKKYLSHLRLRIKSVNRYKIFQNIVNRFTKLVTHIFQINTTFIHSPPSTLQSTLFSFLFTHSIPIHHTICCILPFCQVIEDIGGGNRTLNNSSYRPNRICPAAVFLVFAPVV